MITAGVDVGAEAVKVVILSDSKVTAYSMLKAGLDRKRTCELALEEALNSAGLSPNDITRIVATGVGRKEAAYAHDSVTEIAADARGVAFLFPQARTIIDVGAEEARGIRCNDTGKVIQFAKNEKCAAGVGAFVESMARALETTVEEMGPLSLKSTQEIPMNATCVVFAESEVVSLIHAKTPKPDIAWAIHDAIATRTASMVWRVGIEKEVAFIGGLAKNIGVVGRLKSQLGTDLLIPEEPQLVGALGAALIAQG